jgi:hypothetical protein
MSVVLLTWQRYSVSESSKHNIGIISYVILRVLKEAFLILCADCCKVRFKLLLFFRILVVPSDSLYKLPATLYHIGVISRNIALCYTIVLKERRSIARLVQEINLIPKVELKPITYGPGRK